MRFNPLELKQTIRIAGAIILALALTALFRLNTWPSVFHDGGVYFTDGDCYSRMTRAAKVFQGEAFSIRQHAFENHPEGTSPHTTGVLDWLIAGLALVLRPFSGEIALDLAGAWIGPLLAIGAAGILLWAFWKRPGAWMAVSLFAVSPILVHGSALGRPDHQALQIFFLAAFLSFRWRGFAEKPSRNEALLAGVSLGMALWVSLYEPVILAVLFLILELAFNRSRLFVRERAFELGALVSVLLIAALIDGVRWSPPDTTKGGLFARWSTQIGELRSVGWSSTLIQSWIGWTGFLAAAGSLYLAFVRRDPRLAAWTIAWVVLLLLSGWQVRWGYFLALATVFLVSTGLDWIPWRAARWGVFLILLWPIWQSWRSVFAPDDSRREMLTEQREDARLSREVAVFLKANSEPGAGVLAPWWISPQLAYWSGLPCVAGSSHQSLPGIESTARFYLEQDATVARQILETRKVTWVVAYEPDRIFQTAVPLILRPPHPSAMAAVLYRQTNLAPRFLKLAYVNDFFRVYRTQSP